MHYKPIHHLNILILLHKGQTSSWIGTEPWLEILCWITFYGEYSLNSSEWDLYFESALWSTALHLQWLLHEDEMKTDVGTESNAWTCHAAVRRTENQCSWISQRIVWRIIIVNKLLGSKVWPTSKPKTSTKRGQGLQVLVHSFSRNIGILIHVYLSLNLAAASALHSKIHLISQICCDVSKTLTLVDRSTKNLPSFDRVVWSVNHESFTISGNGRPCLTRSDAVLRWSSVVKPVNMNQTSSLSENSLK